MTKKWKSKSCEVYQALEAKNGTNIHCLNQSTYIPTWNESGAAKIKVFSTRSLRKTNP